MTEKTEQPTPKKLRDARKKGQIAHSKEVVSTVMLISMFSLLFVLGSTQVENIKNFIALPTIIYRAPFEEAFKLTLEGVIKISIDILLPYIALATVAAIVANVGHIGLLFSIESIKFDVKKISPIAGIKRIFSLKNFIELIKSIVKVIFLSVLIYLLIASNIQDMVKLPFCGISCLMPFINYLLLQLAIYSIIAFILIAALDFLYQKYDHQKKLKMSIDEVKREYKETEGDPEVVGQRKQFHREILDNALIDNVKKTSVIVTNPTHYAIGIYYDGDPCKLPIVTIKSRNKLAQHIKKIAMQEGIPIMENVPLARALYAQAELENYIPSELIAPVADVLKWVASLEENKSTQS